MSRERIESESLKGAEQKSFGVSFDGYFGFPIFEEVSSSLIVTTAPGYHVGAIKFQKKIVAIQSGMWYNFGQQKNKVEDNNKGVNNGRDN